MSDYQPPLHTPLSISDCRRLAGQGFAESVELIIGQRRADGAIAKATEPSEFVILDDRELQRQEMVIQVLSAVEGSGFQQGDVLKVKATGQAVLVLEVLSRAATNPA